MLSRTIGRIVRGNATPFQLLTACVLGALLGFAPEPLKAPALYVLLFATLLVVNANLGLALLVAAAMRVVALLATPVSFYAGRAMLDGPWAGLPELVVNAPILAWCGLEYYAVVGGQLVGLALGVGVGFLVTRAIARFRRRMAAAPDEPTRLRAMASKRWGRALIWLVLGPEGKGTWEDKLATRVGNPVRVWGAAVLVLGLALAFVARQGLADALARRGIRSGLEMANGATVDVAGVEAEIFDGRLAVLGLAMADPNALERDVFRASHLELDVDQVDFLRKRFHVQKLIVEGAESGVPRDEPGKRVESPAADVYDEQVGDRLPDLEDLKDLSLKDVIAEYETWRDRLAQVRRWIDRLSGDPSAKKEGDESFSDRLARAVAEKGWADVKAGHLKAEAPTFRLSELSINSLTASFLPGREFALHATELSTHPHLVDAPPRVDLRTEDGAIGFAIDLGPVSRGGGDGGLSFHWNGLAVDGAMALLKLGDRAPFSGGTLDLSLDGAWQGGRIGFVDATLKVTLHDTTLHVEGIDQAALDELSLPIRLTGALDSPRISLPPNALKDALVAAGKKELADRVGAAVKEKLGELEQKTGVKVPKLPGGLDGVLKRGGG
jgi:uncharacterized protein (TIGR03546 family)